MVDDRRKLEEEIMTITARQARRPLRALAAALVAFLAVTGPATAADAAAEAAIRAIVAEQAAAWTAGDARAYTSRLAADASFTNLYGMVMFGAPAFEKRHAEILATFYKGTKKVHRVRRVHFVTPEVAIVDIDNEVHGVTSMPIGVVPQDGIVRTQLMEIFVRRDGQWWVEAYHNVDLKPGAPAAK
jgi:uncharacterized protein (TIGR02246 family)